MSQFLYLPYLKYKNALYSDKTDRMGYIITDSDDEEVHKKYMNDLNSEYNSIRQFDSMNFGSANFNYINKKYGIIEYKNKTMDNTKYDYYEIPCKIKDMNDKDIDNTYFYEKYGDGDMFINIFDFDLSKINEDAESELKFWVKDSMSINIHNEIPYSERLKMLPIKTIKIKQDGFNWELCNCRIIEFSAPFTVAILSEKIKK